MVRAIVNDEVRAWRAACPLRIWMDRQKPGDVIARLKKATGAGSHQTIFAWLYGQAMPRADKLAAIYRLTRISPNQWIEWYSQRPKEVKSCEATETRGS